MSSRRWSPRYLIRATAALGVAGSRKTAYRSACSFSPQRAELDDLAAEIANGDVATTRATRVTRTDVATAALRVAVQERLGQLG